MHLPIITDNTNTVIHPTPIAIHLIPIHLPILHLLQMGQTQTLHHIIYPFIITIQRTH
jgi:hypothetical protein